MKEDDLINQAVEQELEEQYKQREKDEEIYQQDIYDILDVELDQQEIKQAELKADKIISYYAYDKWKRLFEKVSFCNEVPCQILFHVVLGQLLSKKKIFQTNNFLDYRIHSIWIQDSGSGKGTAVEFVNKICRRLKNFDGKDFTYYSSGIDTVAAMVDNPIFDNKAKKYLEQVRPGILSNYNIIAWAEAISLFRPMGEFNEGKIRAILDGVEPYGSNKNIHTKFLVSWPLPTNTISSASFIATSRPIPKLRGEVLYSGLFQRFLTYIRKLSFEERKKMNELAALSSFGDKSDSSKYSKEEQELIDELKDLQKFGKANEILPNPKDKVLKLIHDKMNYLMNNCWQDIIEAENRSLVESFISRMRDNLIKLSAHSAIMRKSKYIEMCDVEYGFELIKKCYESLKVWIELDIGEEENNTFKLRVSKVLRLFEHGKVYSSKDLIKEVKTTCRIGETSAYNLISRMCDGENSFLIRKGERNGLISRR